MANENQGNGGGSLRGFAAMDRQRQREIASLGGRAAHEKGTAHEFTPEEARVAGRKGGEAVSGDRSHMAAIGRKGGENSRGGRRNGANGSNGQRAGTNGGAAGEMGNGGF
ncbi:MAG TPA: KGG domain-containing protein [Xanthomonadales bacterium]|nr:KGG domain-containing protein [Xanthomonadales bacterium]